MEPASNTIEKRVWPYYPIVGLALEILEPRLKAANDGRLFASRAGTSPNAGLVGKAIRARRSRMPIAEFRSHDLRRTVATEMAKLGLPLETVALTLGHQAKAGERTLQKHYVHDEFVDRKTHALATWDRRLRTILTGEAGKVVAFG
jgi:integrase